MSRLSDATVSPSVDPSRRASLFQMHRISLNPIYRTRRTPRVRQFVGSALADGIFQGPNRVAGRVTGASQTLNRTLFRKNPPTFPPLFPPISAIITLERKRGHRLWGTPLASPQPSPAPTPRVPPQRQAAPYLLKKATDCYNDSIEPRPPLRHSPTSHPKTPQ